MPLYKIQACLLPRVVSRRVHKLMELLPATLMEDKEAKSRPTRARQADGQEEQLLGHKALGLRLRQAPRQDIPGLHPSSILRRHRQDSRRCISNLRLRNLDMVSPQLQDSPLPTLRRLGRTLPTTPTPAGGGPRHCQRITVDPAMISIGS